MIKYATAVAFFSVMVVAFPGNRLRAQGDTTQEFHQIFTTAGYAAAFGAALGAAALSFEKHPEQNLRFVAVGASLGFFGGSMLGTYLVFNPIVVQSSDLSHKYAELPNSQSPITVRPYLVAGNSLEIRGIEGVFTLATF